MIRGIANLRVGDKVHYQPSHFDESHWENGIIKEIRQTNLTGVWVVYRCAEEWERYQEYTGALTDLTDLNLNWRFS